MRILRITSLRHSIRREERCFFFSGGGVEGRRDVGKRWDRILGKQIKHPNGQILFSIEWMRRNDCCRVLDDAILHGSLNFSSLSPITLHYSPIRRRFPLPSAAKRATSFFSRRFIGNNVFPLLRWFLFLGGKFLSRMMERMEKLLSILWLIFWGEFRIFLFFFSYIREYGIRRRNWINL